MQRLTRKGQLRPPRHAEPYQDGEIALVYLFKKSPDAQARLAVLLQRTEDAVDLIWGWCDGRRFPPKAANKIKEQVRRVREILGAGLRGVVSTGPDS